MSAGAPSNQGLDQQIQDLQRKIKDMQSQGAKGGQGAGELDELMKLLEKLLKQKNDQGAQGNQGAEDGQGRGQGQIQMPETQGSGKVGG
ncbi:hypothetical protein [Pseudomonas canadensis]|uniref:hypothetical protein n=1 Tax=Pseudomonas canadensis TaxID=915099 RepID=UPI002736A6AD|nr:hypothetical protein [Pseudomonas canadensis]WLH31285.1 hypothetical protein PSH56_06115 [Pseudomonas canadensis]